MSNLRYPAVPLITVDPHFNIWSCADKLYDDITRYWTSRRQNLLGLINIDGKTFRFMGKLHADGKYNIEPDVIEQKSVKVYPMRSVYTFENEAIRLTLTFMTPLLTNDLKLMSRPVSYISYKFESLDNKEHEIKLDFLFDSEITVNNPNQEITAEIYEGGIRCGKGDRDVLSPTAVKGDKEMGGDDRNIDWGWLHVFSKNGFAPVIKTVRQLHRSIAEFSHVHPTYNKEEITPGKSFLPVNMVVYTGLEKEFTLAEKGEEGFICVAYDDIHSIKYFGEIIDAYYKKDGETFDSICKKALEEYDEICIKVEKAENELLEKAAAISPKYADIISLAYRQVIASHKLTWDGKELQFFSKECFSNGCIGTLDVTYPSIPLFLMTNPALVEGMLNPLFKYVNSGNWPFDFAPHDVGQYPFAGGQVYGIDENGNQKLEYQMPVEECGNAILCVYAICHYKKDFSYFEKHKEILEKWVQYLLKFGLDPENQLCTDDFAGHLAHNCNLSLKAIMGIAAYGKMLEKTGSKDSEAFILKAKEYAKKWEETASSSDHFRLAFDKEDTWSIKYNMVWDKIFGWGIFSPDIAEKEVKYYMSQVRKYGIPLDSRSDYTKTDWMMWSACITDNIEYRDMVINTMWDMLNETKSRAPFTDWYYASTAMQCGFQNRTVQGGLFIPMI